MGATKLKKSVIGKLAEAFAIDASVKEACYYAGIHKDTYYDWVKKYPTLADHFERLRERLPLKARQNIAGKIESGDSEISQWFLSHKKPDEFSSKVKVEHSGQVDADITLVAHPEIEELRKQLKQKLKDSIREESIKKANQKPDEDKK